MKNHRVVLFTTLIVLVLRGTVMAQWVQMTPNYGQNVLAFTEQGGNLLAGTDNGVFLSTDNGTNWKASGLTGSTVQALEVSGGNVFAGTTNGIYISVNDGGSWTFIGMSGLSVTGFAAVGSKIFVATYGDGVYAGMGIDSNWTPSGLSSGNLTAIDTLVGRIFVSMAGGGVFCSSDSGETWSTANNGMWTTDVSCLLINGTNIYAGTDVGVFMSSNQGSNWNPINSGWSDICNAPANALAYAGGNIIAGADNSNKHSIVLSTDQGGSWVPSVTNVGVGVEVLAAFGTDIFAGTSMGGVFRSTDAGLTWEGMGLAGGHYSEAGGCLAVSGNNLYLGFKGGGVLLSTDDGESWVGVNRGLVNSYVTALQVNGKDLFAGTSNGLFLTTDGGSNWNEIGFWGKSVSSVSSSGGTILTGTGEGLYVSTNSGFTWRFASEVVGDYGLYRPIKFLAIKDSLAIANLVGAGGQIGTVFVSTNGGVNWSQCFYLQGPYTYPLVGYSVIISETNLFVGDGYGIRISTDSGRTWSDYLTPWMNETTTCFAMSDTELFAATYDVGIIASGRMGTRWTNNSDGLTDLDITSLCVNSGYLFAVDDSSRVWRRPLSEMIVDVKEHTKGLPSAFSLSQNYPNPFNPSTVISYQVPTNSTVMLKVYDVLGREIETLVNGRETAGTHSVTFDGTKLPSGVYFCRLTAPGVNIVRKMLLEK